MNAPATIGPACTVNPQEPDIPQPIYPLKITVKGIKPPIWGYDEFLEAIGNPKHPDHEDMLDWVGDDFDPDAFDLEAANRAT